jgi:tetratricopeptide (TPR) repeat protein
MKQLNLRLLLPLLGALVLGSIAVYLVHGWQMGRLGRVVRAQVEQAEADGRLDRVALYLQRYLVFAPGDVESLARYGQLLEQRATSSAESWRALEVYHSVLQRDPSRYDIRRQVALLGMRLGWYAEARENLQLLAAHQDENGAERTGLAPGEVQSLLGQCQERDGDYRSAVESYQKAIRQAPAQVDTYVRLANVMRDQLNEPRKAAKVLDDLLRVNGGSFEAHLARAVQWMNQGRYPEAARDMANARARAPDNLRVLLTAADLAERRGQPEEARRLLEHAREVEPRSASAHLALASLDVRLGRTEAALACLRQGVQNLPDQLDLLAQLGETLIEHGDLREADEMRQRLQRRADLSNLADYLRGRLLLKRQERPAAIRTLEGVLHSPECPPLLAGCASLALGQAYEQSAEGDRQLAALRQGVERDPESAIVRLALAAALAANNRTDEALEQYREAVQLPRAPDESWILLARLLVERNRHLSPRQRNWAEVDRVLERAGQLPTQEAALALVQADSLVLRDKPEQARAVLDQARKQHPDDVSLAAALAELALLQGDSQRAAKVLADTPVGFGDSLKLSRVEVKLALLVGDREARKALKKLEKGLKNGKPDEQVSLLILLTTAYAQLGEAGDARRVGRLLADRAGTDLRSRLQVLEVALQVGDEEILEGLIAEVRRLEGEEGTWWRYGEAARRILLAQRGRRQGLDEARALVAELGRRRPDWSHAALLQAFLDELDGKQAAVVSAYLRAFNLGERRADVVQRLVRLLVEADRLDDAEEVIRRFQQQETPSVELARMGAEIALRQHNIGRALELARLAAPADAKDYGRLIWLGQILARCAQPVEAEEVLRRAVELRSDLAETWIALIAHQVRARNVPDAERTLASMHGKLPANQEPLAVAICSEVLGRFDRAEQEYALAMKRRPDDGLVLQRAACFHLRLNHLQKAEPLLRRMLSPDVNLPELNQAWARRQLALVLASLGGEARYQEAKKLLQQNQRGGTDSVLDRRADALVQATRPEKRSAALKTLDELGKMQPWTAEELFRLAQLYELEDDFTRARDEMVNLLTLDPNNPEYVAHHIQLLLGHRKKDEARAWIVRLQKLEPDSQRLRDFQGSLKKTN